MAHGNFQVATGEVNILYPGDERPEYRPTFILQGLLVTWSAAPTTAEEVELRLVIDEFNNHEFLLRDFDPSPNVMMTWFYSLDMPIAVPINENVKVTYPNTDNNVVTVKVVGYYSNG